MCKRNPIAGFSEIWGLITELMFRFGAIEMPIRHSGPFQEPAFTEGSAVFFCKWMMAELAASPLFWKFLRPASSVCVFHAASSPFHHCGDFIWCAVFFSPDIYTEATSWWLADCVCLEIDRKLTDVNACIGRIIKLQLFKDMPLWHFNTETGNVFTPFCFTMSFVCIPLEIPAICCFTGALPAVRLCKQHPSVQTLFVKQGVDAYFYYMESVLCLEGLGRFLQALSITVVLLWVVFFFLVWFK